MTEVAIYRHFFLGEVLAGGVGGRFIAGMVRNGQMAQVTEIHALGAAHH